MEQNQNSLWEGLAYQSADGMKIVGGGDYLFFSTDGGGTWQQRAVSSSTNAWQAIASSADGKVLAAASITEDLYTSQDGGLTWHQETGAGHGGWKSVSVSADGSKIFAVAPQYSGTVFIGTRSGITMISRPSQLANALTALQGALHALLQLLH